VPSMYRSGRSSAKEERVLTCPRQQDLVCEDAEDRHGIPSGRRDAPHAS
jgi:hypothetical protein